MSAARLLQIGIAGTRGELRHLLVLAGRSHLLRYCCYATVPTLLLVALLGLRCTAGSEASGVHSAPAALTRLDADQSTPDEQALIARAEGGPIALLESAIGRYDAEVQDYEGTFRLEYLADGRHVDRSLCRFKFRSRPFSVLLEWVEGAGRIDKLLYIEGENDGKMIVHPTGLAGRLVSAVAVDPRGEAARKGSSRPVTEFGLRNALARILRSYQTDAGKGALRSRCLGLGEIAGERVITLEKIRPEERLVVDLSTETLLPVRIRQYDSADRQTALYQYGDVRFNRGFTDATFSPGTCGLSD